MSNITATYNRVDPLIDVKQEILKIDILKSAVGELLYQRHRFFILQPLLRSAYFWG